MERIATDILGPLPLSKKGNRFTKWVEAYALPNQLAETVAGVIITEFIARFGVCVEIHSDQGVITSVSCFMRFAVSWE